MLEEFLLVLATTVVEAGFNESYVLVGFLCVQKQRNCKKVGLLQTTGKTCTENCLAVLI